jgi:single-stranded-DNA-specific exonuclease
MRDELIRAMEHGVKALMDMGEKSVQLYHHNDADGITSGAILSCALERQGFSVARYSLEKPYPVALERIYEQEGKILIFADFAGRIAPLLSELNQGRNLTIILDHHVAEPSMDPRVLNLDPDLLGVKGDRDISGSTTCYVFATTLDPVNHDMARLAAIGAVADGFYVDGALFGENLIVAEEAMRQGHFEIRDGTCGEQYLLNTPEGQVPVLEFGDYLDILGGAGYYSGGPETAVAVCREGASAESDRIVEELKRVRTRVFGEEIARLRAGSLIQAPHIQWFEVGTRFFPMGVKVIGAFCDAIRGLDFVDQHKYIAGFQIVPDEIPGFAPVRLNQVKVSMRVPAPMEDEIRAARVTGLQTLLPEATYKLGGFVDACHSLTAATTVAIGKEAELITEMEAILQGDSRG